MADLIYIPSSYLLCVFSARRTGSVRTVALRECSLARHLGGCSRLSSNFTKNENVRTMWPVNVPSSWRPGFGSARCSSVCGDGSSVYIQLDLCEFKHDLSLKGMIDMLVHRLVLYFVALQHARSEPLPRSSVLAERVYRWKCVWVLLALFFSS